MKNAAESLIEDAGQLLDVFGEWPSFEDAQVHRLSLDSGGSPGPTLELVVHLFRRTSEVSPRGLYVRDKHTRLTMRFASVAELVLEDFQDQNILSRLDVGVSDPEPTGERRLWVVLESVFGLAARFQCSRAVVVGVEPWEGPSDERHGSPIS